MGMNPEMDFEYAMRLLLGDSADHIAGQAHIPEYRNKWLHRSVDKMLKLVDLIDTTLRHKERLVSDLNDIRSSLSRASDPSWSLVFHFFSFSGRLLGLDFFGSRINTPVYVQSPEQYYTEHIKSGGDVMQDYYDKKNFISMRRAVVQGLKAKGLNDFQVAMVLNTSEYQVKKLKKEAEANKANSADTKSPTDD